MAVSVERNEKGSGFRVVYAGPWKGLDTKSPSMAIAEDHLPVLTNVDLPAGVPTRIDGYILHATSFDTGTSAPNLLARYIPSSGNAFYITADESGQVYSHVSAGGAPTVIRTGLSTTADLYWTHTQLADYLIIANPTDGNFKWDGTRLIPLGAKYIADMETAEDATWVGGATSTTVREGTQSRTRTTTGAVVTMALTPATAWDLTDGLLSAADYSTTTSRIHFYINFDTVTGLDLTTTYIRLGNAADTAYFQAAASVANWGTLVAGWNRVQIAKSLFATTGAPSWASIAKLEFGIDSTGATIIAIIDDCYLRYSDALTMPSVQYVSNWKNMVLGARSTADPSTFYFSRVSAPDEYSATASFPINEDDGDTITGLHPYYNQVFITKDNTCHSISGTVAGTVYPNYNLETLLVTTEHGGSSHRALVQAGRYIYIWWRGEVHRYNGTGTEKISKLIDPTLATVNMARLGMIVGARRRVLNQIRWYYPDSAATTNTSAIAFDYVTEGFLTVADQTAMPLAEQVFESGTEYLLTVDLNGLVRQQDSGADYAGTAITARVALPWTSAQTPDQLKYWEEVYTPYETNTGDLLVEYRIADHPREMAAASFVTAGTIDQSVAGEHGRVFIGERAVWLQLRYSTVGARMTLFPPTILIGHFLGAGF
jgi:hypothetical protein